MKTAMLRFALSACCLTAAQLHGHGPSEGETLRLDRLHVGGDGGVVVDRMRNGTGNLGFDAASGRYVDLIEAGIVDPTKVVRVALENAVSVASVLLLTEATMTELPEAEKKFPSEGEMGMNM